MSNGRRPGFSVASDFFTSKTTWTAIAGIITALAGAYAGQITWEAAVAAVFALLMQGFRRDAEVKTLERTSR